MTCTVYDVSFEYLKGQLSRIYGLDTSGMVLVNNRDMEMDTSVVEERTKILDDDTENIQDIIGMICTLGQTYYHNQSTPVSRYSPLPNASMVHLPESENITNPQNFICVRSLKILGLLATGIGRPRIYGLYNIQVHVYDAQECHPKLHFSKMWWYTTKWTFIRQRQRESQNMRMGMCIFIYLTYFLMIMQQYPENCGS